MSSLWTVRCTGSRCVSLMSLHKSRVVSYLKDFTQLSSRYAEYETLAIHPWSSDVDVSKALRKFGLLLHTDKLPAAIDKEGRGNSHASAPVSNLPERGLNVSNVFVRLCCHTHVAFNVTVCAERMKLGTTLPADDGREDKEYKDEKAAAEAEHARREEREREREQERTRQHDDAVTEENEEERELRR